MEEINASKIITSDVKVFFYTSAILWTNVESRTVTGTIMGKLGSQGLTVFSDCILKPGFLSAG